MFIFAYKIVRHLRSLELETFHINEILDKWHTKDADICEYTDVNDLIVLSKDADFRNSFLINHTPKKLVKINLGNISTTTLQRVISENLPSIKKLYSSGGFMLELDQNSATFIKMIE